MYIYNVAKSYGFSFGQKRKSKTRPNVAIRYGRAISLSSTADGNVKFPCLRTTLSPTVTAHMTTKLTFVIISIFLLLISCDKKQTDLEFEKSVANEIFPALLDSVFHDTRLAPPPPPPPNSEWNDSTAIKWDESKMITEYEKRKAELEKDTTKLVIAIVDSTYQINQRAKKELIEFYKDYEIELDTLNITESYKINLTDLKHAEKFKLKYRSELPATSKVWKDDYDFYLSGITGFSRIQFDRTKNYGVMISGFGCGRLCGFSGLVFIRKTNGKWIIDKVKVTAVS